MKKIILLLFTLSSLVFSQSVTWTQINNTGVDTPEERALSSMISVGSGTVMMFGGNDANGLDDKSYFFDQNSGSWTFVDFGPRPTNRRNHDFVVMNSSQALLFGGLTTGQLITNVSNTYNYINQEWNGNAGLDLVISPSPRENHAMAKIRDNQVLLFGGKESDNSLSNESWSFDATAGSSGSWYNITHQSNNPPARFFHTLARLNDNEIYLFGGISNTQTNEQLNDLWLFNTNTNSWTELRSDGFSAPGYPIERGEHGMIDVGYNHLVMYGKRNKTDENVYIFDGYSRSFSSYTPNVSNRPANRDNVEFARISNYEVLMFGGSTISQSRNDDTWILEVFLEPRVFTHTFSVIDATSASFTADLIDGNRSTTLTYRIGTETGVYSDTFEATDSPFSANSGTNTGTYTANNLDPNTDYYYVAYAENIEGYFQSGELTFTTTAAEPEVYLGEQISSTGSSASINFQFYNGNANSSSVNFYTGTMTGVYEDEIAFSGNNIDGSTSTLSLIEEFTGLEEAKDYYYVIEVWNEVGSTTSTEGTFTTLSNEPTAHSGLFEQDGEYLTDVVLNYDMIPEGATGYVIIRKNTAFQEGDLPVDGNYYSKDDPIGDATVMAVITNGSQTSSTFMNQQQEKSWQFALIPFNRAAGEGSTNYLLGDYPDIQGFTIPTLGEWGMIIFGGLMLICGVWQVRRVV
jgi:hypothetical protein